MAIVDERGRLFGRWNLIDLAVLVLIAGLIPLGYAAYVLFRERPPRLVSVSPNRLEEAPEFRITITGENLRPYMRVSIGAYQGRDFLFKSTEEVEVPFAAIRPGTYDVVLYDQAQERFRLPNALTIAPSPLPSTEMVAIGAFGNLDAAGAAKLVAGTKLPGVGEIVSVGKAVPDGTDVFSGAKLITVPIREALRLPAVVKLTCHIRTQQGTPYCSTGDITITPKQLLMIPTALGTTPFQIQRVRSTHPVETAMVSMRLVGHPSVLAQVKAGDADTGGLDHDLGLLARVERVGALRSIGSSAAEMEVTLAADLQRADSGWLYDSAPLRIGGSLTLRTGRYEVSGTVTAITPRQ